jgi:tetratricopeptide (TPR) repeat protein
MSRVWDSFTDEPRSAAARTPFWAAPLSLILLTFAAYSPVLRNGFVWDDDSHITASALNFAPGGFARIWTSAEAMQYYPLTFSVFRLEHALWGFDPRGYHLLNVLLHALNAVGLALVLKRLRVPGAWWAAALFALHPVNVESVAWATELKNVLCLLFALAATDRWLAFGEARRERDYALALLAYGACLLSKTAAVLLPAVFLVADWARGRAVGRRELGRAAPFFALGGTMSVVTILYERYRNGADPAFALPWAQRPLLAGRAVWFYAAKLAAPVGLAFIYPRWRLDASSVAQWTPSAAAVALGAWLWTSRRRLGRAPAAAAAAFVLFLFPVLGFFDVFFMRFSFVADHFAYFALAAALALVPAALERAVPASAPRRALLVALVAVLGALTWSRARAFHDPETLWRDTLEKNPAAWMAWENLAVAEIQQGRWAEAEEHAARAISLLPGFGVAWYYQGVAQWNQGKKVMAAASFERCLDVAPLYKSASSARVALAETYLGMWAAERGRPSEAVARMRLAAEAEPGQSVSWFNLANALESAARPDETLAACRRGLALSPGSPAGAACRAAAAGARPASREKL